MPGVLSAQNTGAAVIFPAGTVYLNGAQVSNSSAFMTGNLLQARENGAANINAAGSSAVVDSNSIVRFQPDGFSLDRGSFSWPREKAWESMRVISSLPLLPASGPTSTSLVRAARLESLREGSSTVNCGANTATVKEGQQISRDDAPSCGLITKGNGAPAAVKGPILTAARVGLGALAPGGIIATWASSHSDDPVSPKHP